jgi:DNA-binding transcriptional MocR family regulator
MPSKSTRKRLTTQDDVRRVAADAAQAAATAPVSAPVATTPTLPPTAPDTAATRGVWAALAAQPGSTAVILADAAGISRPTASKALAALESAGLATRTPGGRDGSKRLPDLWQPVAAPEVGASADEVTEAPEPAVADDDAVSAEEAPDGEREPDDGHDPVADAGEPEDGVEDASAAPAPKPAKTTTTKSGEARLGSGQLREMVLAHLRGHSDEEFSPSAIAKVLARSSGAVANCCDSLLIAKAVVQTNEKPRRFRIAAS